MKNILQIIIFIAFVSCSNNSENHNKNDDSISLSSKTLSTIAESEENQKNDLQIYQTSVQTKFDNTNFKSFDDAINSLPVFGTETHFKFDFEKTYIETSKHFEGTIKPIEMPDKMFYYSTDTTRSFELNYNSIDIPLKSKKEYYDSLQIIGNQKNISIHFYFIIDLNNNYINIFSSFNELTDNKITNKEWKIYSFDRKGILKSEIGRCSEFYILNNEIISLWWYASDYDCAYETWFQDKKGYYHLKGEEYKMPNSLDIYIQKYK